MKQVGFTTPTRQGMWWYVDQHELEETREDGGKGLAGMLVTIYPQARELRVVVHPWTDEDLADASLTAGAPEWARGTVGWTAVFPAGFLLVTAQERLN